MTKKSELGQYGEDLACRFLIKNGYKIVERNFRKPWGEIDIIAKSPDKTLVFVEVKTMQDRGELELKPEDQLSQSKLTKVAKTANMYAGSNEKLVDKKRGWQIDLIAITIDSEGAPSITHYQNIA